MAKQKSPRQKKFFSPFLLSLAGAAGWAATHSPGSLSSPSVIGAWVISALAIGLVVRAVLALVGPILKLGGDLFRHSSGTDGKNNRNDL